MATQIQTQTQEYLERKVDEYLKEKWGSKYVPEGYNYIRGYAFGYVYEDGIGHGDYIKDTYIYGLYEGELILHQEDPIIKNGYSKDLPYVRIVHFHKG